MMWRLPESLEIGGSVFRIRTDYRDILTVFQAFNDPELPDWGKTEVMLQIIYCDREQIPEQLLNEAVNKAVEFIDHGVTDDGKPKPKIMDWEQDEGLIVSAINKVAGVGDVRSLPYLHWWTFIGYYMEIGASLFSQVMNIRYKRLHGKKLEKWEREWARDNRELIRLRKSEDERAQEEAERQALRELIGV